MALTINLRFNGSFKTKEPILTTLNKPYQTLTYDKVSFTSLKKNKYAHEIDVIEIFNKILPKKPYLSQKELNTVLTSMGKDFLKENYKNNWTKENPTLGYCYAVTEFIHYFVDSNTQPFCLSFDDGSTHWFLKKANGNKIDFTRDQFTQKPLEYNKAKPKGFLTDFPSKRACEIAVRFGIISREAANAIPLFQRELRNSKSKNEEITKINEFKKLLNPKDKQN